jgi:hypothetical protein
MLIEFKSESALALNYPPVPAKKMVPEWYKELSEHNIDEQYINDAEYLYQNNIKTTKTIKGCIPVQDYLTSGYIIRAHSEILVTPKQFQDYSAYSYMTAETKIDAHRYEQCPVKINNAKNIYMMYINCWRIKVPAVYSCLFYQPKFFLEERYTLFPAIVDCDVFDSVVNFPGYVNSKESFYIKPGDPVMAVFPFKRDAWESSVSLLSDEEKKIPSKTFHYLHTRYKRVFHKKKNYS